MRKALTLAILGTALVAPLAARAQGAPAFVGATACEAAAPLRTDALATHRAVSARGMEAASAAQRPASRRVQDRGGKASGQPVAEAEGTGAVDDMPVLRRAVHFCVGTPGVRRTWLT